MNYEIAYRNDQITTTIFQDSKDLAMKNLDWLGHKTEKQEIKTIMERDIRMLSIKLGKEINKWGLLGVMKLAVWVNSDSLTRNCVKCSFC